MRKYRGTKLIRSGFIGIVLMVLIIAVGLQPERITSMATKINHRALFAEAGGLMSGDTVRISGIEVGRVTRVALNDGKAEVDFLVDSTVRLGSRTTAKIKTGSLLGKRVLDVTSEGPGKLRSADVIPVERTSSPYSLTDAIGDITTNVGGTDTATLNQSLDTLSDTLDQIAPELGPTFEAMTALSRSLNERDSDLRDLLTGTAKVTAILGERSDKLNTLLLNANDLVGVLAERRQAIVSLLANVSVVATQLSGVIEDNNAELKPTLEKLNSVIDVLQRNRDNIGKALPGLAQYATSLGESVASGPYYNAFVGNLLPGPLLQPFIDAAFRQTPRAKLPLPHRELPLSHPGVPAPEPAPQPGPPPGGTPP